MSPEQATGERRSRRASDIYSLGCVMYEMLAGEPPHTGATAQQIIMRSSRKIRRRRRSCARRSRRRRSRGLAALEKFPADRFENAKAFADALTNPAYGTLGVVRLAKWRARAAVGARSAEIGVASSLRGERAPGVGDDASAHLTRGRANTTSGSPTARR